MKIQTAIALILFFCAGLFFAQTGPSKETVKGPDFGIVLLAHGGRVRTWNEEVRHVADQVDLSIPTEVAFGMATRRTMQEAVDRLAARGVKEIIAVPLFVSSHSSVITSIRYLFGLEKVMPEDLKMFAGMDHSGTDHSKMDHSKMEQASLSQTKPLTSSTPIRMTFALDHHQLVSKILLDRAAAISSHAKHEVVILAAHGPVSDEENKLWLNDMSLLAAQMKRSSRYAGIEYLTVRDDADDKVRDAATKELRDRVQAVVRNGQTALIVPLLLSYGGIDDGMKERLKGLNYKMAAQGLLPDRRIVEWVLDVAKKEAADATLAAPLTRRLARFLAIYSASTTQRNPSAADLS
jgi:sirohydrochlorin ferrochelatase